MRHLPTPPTQPALAFALVCLAGCSGSGGSGSAGPTASSAELKLLSISIANQSVQPLNREIRFGFSLEVDFRSVSNLSIQIAKANGVAATGSFGPLLLDTDADGIADSADPSVVVWQPACPILNDLSDAGLQPNSAYVVRLRGSDSNAALVVSGLQGGLLKTSETRSFSTPNSTELSVLFEDPVAGGPAPLIRARGSLQQLGVSYVELGGDADPASRLYFERDGLGSESIVVPGPGARNGALAPLNLYSDEASSVAFVIELNQPVNPSQNNLSNTFIQLEYMLSAAAGNWVPLDTRVELLSNCLAVGTTLRLEPRGLLPAGSQVRAVLRSGLQGLGGVFDGTTSDQFNFAIIDTQEIDHAPLGNPERGADELRESFDLGGNGPNSLEDTEAQLVVPSALWGQGRLSASLNFGGTGGPGASFDWIVSGTPESFDTSQQTIVGGPNGMRSFEQFTVGGLVDVHDFIIEPNAILRVSGPNPFVVNATGEIRIEGILDISGFSARDVATLNTGSQPEKGGAGTCGGGDGGGTSQVRGNSTPSGDRGFGPFGSGSIGGFGSESALSAIGGPPSNRRPGGAGGGRFSINQSDLDAAGTLGPLPTEGMAAKRGGRGDVNSEGALSGTQPAPGASAGPGAFRDGDDKNDFFGFRVDTEFAILADGTPPVLVSRGGIIVGELIDLHAGYGGGGGGDAVQGPRFPTANWTVSSDEKGGGGGGGAGVLRLRALGPIRFVGLKSRLICKGGSGATGESMVGGTGGSGSGGHVILESASNISFELPPVLERPEGERRHIFVDARGFRARVATGPAVSLGGEGGPGLIQLHVPDALSAPHEDRSLSDLVLPVGTIEDLDAGDSNALLEVMRPAGVQLLPSFGALSGAQSRWINVRTAGLNPDGSRDLLRFLFRGIAPQTGAVLTSNGQVNALDALLSGSVDGLDVSFQGSDVLRLNAAALQPLIASRAPISDDIYLRTPVLLRNFILRMTPGIGASIDFIIQDASYDSIFGNLSLRTGSSSGIELGSLAAAATQPAFELIPRFFSISSAGLQNALASNSEVRFSFEGARSGVDGFPDEATLLVPQTSDVSDFELLAPGQLEFIRFRVDFNLDVAGTGVQLGTPGITLDFLRLPFVY